MDRRLAPVPVLRYAGGARRARTLGDRDLVSQLRARLPRRAGVDPSAVAAAGVAAGERSRAGSTLPRWCGSRHGPMTLDCQHAESRRAAPASGRRGAPIAHHRRAREGALVRRGGRELGDQRGDDLRVAEAGQDRHSRRRGDAACRVCRAHRACTRRRDGQARIEALRGSARGQAARYHARRAPGAEAGSVARRCSDRG